MTVQVEALSGQGGSGPQARGRQAAGKLFLVETVDEARSVLAYLDGRQLAASAVTIVGLEPAARAFLAQQDVPCIDTLAYFDNASHSRALLKSEEIMQLVLRDLKPDLGDGLDEIYASSFIAPLHGRVRLMLRTIEILEGIRCAHPHSTLFICSPPAGPAGTLYQPETHLHRPEWGFLTTLGPRFCRMHGVPLEIVPQDAASRRPVRAEPPGGSIVPTGRRSWWAALSDRFVSACYLLAFRLGSGAGSVLLAPNAVGEAAVTGPLRARCPGAKLLAFRLGRDSIGQEARYALGWLLRTILHREPGDRIRTIPLDVIQDPWARDRSASAQSALAQAATQFLARNGAWFSCGGVSFVDEVQAVVRDYVLPMWLSLYRPVQAEACVLRHLRPSLALSSTSDGVTRALGELCKLQAIPAMVIPYKSLGSPKNELEVIGERQMGAFFVNDAYAYAGVQSPFAFGYLESTAYGGQALAVGPLLRVRVDAVRRQRERERFFEAMGAPGKVVVYSPSTSFSSIFHVAQSQDEILGSMADLAEVMAGMPGVYLILRLHPQQAIRKSEVEALLDLPPNVVVDDGNRASFASVLALADLLVTNVSTTAEQALNNDIPVILYDRWARYNHLDAPAVRAGAPQELSPAYYVPARDHLGPALSWVLEHQPPGTALPPPARARFAYDWDASAGFYDFVGRMLGRSA